MGFDPKPTNFIFISLDMFLQQRVHEDTSNKPSFTTREWMLGRLSRFCIFRISGHTMLYFIRFYYRTVVSHIFLKFERWG